MGVLPSSTLASKLASKLGRSHKNLGSREKKRMHSIGCFATSSLRLFVFMALIWPLGVVAGEFTFTKIADLTTAIPQGVGNFTSFRGIVVDGHNVAFIGFGQNDQRGIYIFVNDQIEKIAALGDIFPGTQKVFSVIDNIVINGDGVAFRGLTSNSAFDPSGVFLSRDGVLETIIKRGDLVPGSGDHFSGGIPNSFNDEILVF